MRKERRTSMPTKTEAAVVAVFRNISDAQAAAGELTANAFAGDHIHIAAENTESTPRTDQQPSRDAGHLEKNVESWCKATFGQNQETERDHYKRIVHGGNALLGLDTPEQMVGTATDILNHHSPVDLARHEVRRVPRSRSIVSKTADQSGLQTAAGTNAPA
jgi:hypothetical protein